MYDLIVIGGGAAGFFTAIQVAERRPGSRILILEKSKELLGKVRISGGGRCNVTHACFVPKEMIAHYPRGEKELLGPFHRFLCGDMMAWLSERGVETKIEEDGRVFPVSNSSSSIINCFMEACERHQIKVETRSGMRDFSQMDEHWQVQTDNGPIEAKKLMLATGSTPSVWKLLSGKGHSIIPPVPSLFTFNIKHPLIEGLAGISFPYCHVDIVDLPFESSGPLLITHWGLSGPGILKLSAWAARELNARNYDFQVRIDWTGNGRVSAEEAIAEKRKTQGKQSVRKYPLLGMPRRFWERICEVLKLDDTNYGSLDRQQLDGLAEMLSTCTLQVKGKSTFKEEFVTCGGVDLKEVDFKTMESKRLPGLYMAGEVINVDAITGGFNFQAAWTESFIAAEHIASVL